MRWLAALLLSSTVVSAQVLQSGTVTPGHVAEWVIDGVVRDGGTAAEGNLTSVGVTTSGSGICQNSALTTAAGYQQICLGATTAGGAIITAQNFGTATAQGLTFVVNGTSITLGAGSGNTVPSLITPVTAGQTICATDADGTLQGCDGQTVTGIFNVTQSYRLSGDLTPTTLTGDVNSYNPTGLSTASVLRIDGGASNRNITGLAGGAHGRSITILNIGANSLVLKNQSGASSAANQFQLGADITITTDQSVLLWYDSTTAKWRAQSAYTVAGGSPAGTVTSVACSGVVTCTTIVTAGTVASTSIADKTVWSNVSGGSAVPSANNLADIGASTSLISCGDFSASSNVLVFDNFTSVDYGDYMLLVRRATPQSDGANVVLQVGIGGGPTYQTSGYLYGAIDNSPAASANVGSTTNSITSSIVLNGGTVGVDNGGSSAGGLSSTIWFDAPTSARAMIRFNSTFVASDTTFRNVTGGGFWDTATTITSVRLATSTGNFQTFGSACLYGIRNS